MNSDMVGKRERLAALLAKERRPAAGDVERVATAAPAGHPTAVSGPPSDPHAPFPLTRIQQSYLIGRSDEFVLGNVSTHNYFEIELDRLDVDRFSAAWNALIARHEMLRAVFADDGAQRILPGLPQYAVAFHDFGGTDPDAAARAMTALRERMSHQTLPFDRWPLFEVAVARHPDGRYRLHFSIDMLIADAMSTMILIRDLDALYAAPETPLSPLTYSFRSYVESVSAVEGSEAYAQARAYWDARVDHLPSAPELPLATTPESIAHPRFVRREHMIDAERWERCQKRVQAAGLTSSALLIALFSIVLARWAKSGHFCLNLTLLNRPPLHPQMGDLVGDFTSLIMLETQVDPGATLIENVRRVQTQLWRDMNHRGFDGVDVLRLLNRRYASQQAVAMPIVFTSALGLSGSRSGESSGEFLSTLIRLGEDSSYGIAQSSQVWLDHVVRESAGALGVSWDALEELFPEGVVDDMFAAYCGLLDRFADERIGFEDRVELPLPQAQAARRAEVNATAAPVPAGLLHEPFLARAAEHGDRIAVRHAQTTLTYRELRALAIGIAHRLDALDGGRSTLIGVVMTKGWEQIAAVLGILCHGAGYLPIDANLPEERVRLLLEQAGVDTVLVQADLASGLRLPEGSRVLPVARDVAAGAAAPAPAARRTPDDIAYVIFTSGSTGIPKGVVIEHRGALNTVVDINRRFRVGADDRVLCVSALSFDLSVYDIFGVLGAGGTLVIPDADRDKDPAHWLALVEDEGVTVWNTVPPLLQLLVEQAEYRDGRGLASLRLALSSGDWLPPELPDRLTALRPGVELVSLGGATEASIWSIYYPVLTSMAGRRSVPYGRPLDNQTFHVFDDSLLDRPDWAAGQLYIGGIGLAREYWGDAGKTAASFIRHPKTGERLYRTGDLGRYLPDGDIEFLGRNDSQVKIRGNRVELGEIEAALRRAEGICDAVVIAQGDKFGKRRLVAYVVPDFGTETPDGSTDGGIDVLADAVERAAFKFERTGLRRFDEATPATPLPGALEAGERIALAFAPGLASDVAGAAPLSLSRLGAWLAHLADIEADGHSLPKRLYPSAGSTYPVQCYLRVGEGRVEGLPAGRYCFDPAHHRLMRIATPASAPGIERAGLDLFLVADRRAIAPLYGRYAEKFAALEAGHIRWLLVGAAPAQGIALAAGVCDAGLAAEFALSAEHRPLIALQAGGCASAVDPRTTATTARQSYRRFDGGALSIDALQSLLAALPTPPFSILVAVHGEAAAADDDPADDLAAARLFRFDAATASLVPAGRIDRAQLRRNQGIENQALHDAAQFTLYLLGDDAVPAWLAAGEWAQQAMHRGPERGFGFCPVGNVAMTGLRDPLRDIDGRLLYALLGGRIAPEQSERWPVEASAAADGSQELRRFLAQSLPDYMIPTVFATIPRIPLSANGKLDRAALPAIGDDAQAQPRAYVAPEGPLEQSVAALWTQVIGRDGIGVHDNFFEIGGDSLSAIRLLSALRREFEAQSGGMTLRFVFEHPTVRVMAERLQSGDQAGKLERAAAELALAGDDVDEGEL